MVGLTNKWPGMDTEIGTVSDGHDFHSKEAFFGLLFRYLMIDYISQIMAKLVK